MMPKLNSYALVPLLSPVFLQISCFLVKLSPLVLLSVTLAILFWVMTSLMRLISHLRQSLLVKKSNYLLNTFSFRDKLTTTKLFMSFCLSLTCCCLWSLSCLHPKHLEVSFNNSCRDNIRLLFMFYYSIPSLMLITALKYAYHSISLALRCMLITSWAQAHPTIMPAKELDSGIEIVHGCFTERGNSILNVFCCECNYKTNNEFLG